MTRHRTLSGMRPDLDRELASLGVRGHRAVVAGVLHPGGRTVRGWPPGDGGPDGRSLFEIGSITKVFTGVLLADMCLRSEVRLDDPVSRHLSSPRPAWRGREPTLLELATHRSGRPNTPTRMGAASCATPSGSASGIPGRT
jgi:CubicO group peptidase (beta-lactamase class C family)